MTSRPNAELLGLAGWIVRRRAWVIVAWVIIVAALAPRATRVERLLDVSARVRGSESAAVDDVLRERFNSPFANYAVLVVTGLPSASTSEGATILKQLVKDIAAVPGVSGTLSAVDHPDSMFVPETGDGTFVLVGFVPGKVAGDAFVEKLRAVTERATAALRPRHPGVALRWSGELALNHDLRRTSAEDARSAEGRALPLTLALLIVVFGALAAALLPIATGLCAITVALGLAAILAVHWPLSILLENIVTMLGLGLGVDYALLMVSRFREELRETPDATVAAAKAARAAGHTILLSAVAVLIGFVILLLIPLDDLRAVAVGGIVVVAVSALLALTLLPALLAMFGRRVDAGSVWRRRRVVPRDRWRWWGAWVARHPLLVLGVAGAPLLLLAWQVKRIETSLPRANWLPSRMESARALDDLRRMGRAGLAQSVRVVVELPPGVSALERDGWRAIARLGDRLEEDPRVERVQSLPWYVASQLGATEPSLMVLSILPAHVLETFVSHDQRTAVLEILPRSEVDYPTLTRFVRELRGRDHAELTGLPGARLFVGGMPAFNADYEDAISSRFGVVVALVVAGTFVALLVGFRSVLVPIKAILLNLLSVAASLGAVVLVFQEGFGGRLFGVGAALGGLFPALPALVFCLVFGLSMDYEVFLVARIAEARREGRDESEAIVEGMARTGGVITSAAAIMVVVFAAFTLGGFLMIKVLGFALATAVLLDATVVRLAIGPALLHLAGRWNWWPGERTRPLAAPPLGETLSRTPMPMK